MSSFFSAPLSYPGSGGAMGKESGKKMVRAEAVLYPPRSLAQTSLGNPTASFLRRRLPHGCQEQGNARLLSGEQTGRRTTMLGGSFCWMPPCGPLSSNATCLLFSTVSSVRQTKRRRPVDTCNVIKWMMNKHQLIRKHNHPHITLFSIPFLTSRGSAFTRWCSRRSKRNCDT